LGGAVKSSGRNGGYDGAVGLDAKIGLTSSLNLNLTINPDFSQVEWTFNKNLDRFELFFPERRQFFLKRRPFNNFGFSSIRPFSQKNWFRYSVVLGGTSYGKVNKLRIGVLNTQTGENSKRWSWLKLFQ
jgi:hypothetical protein